MQNMRGKRIFGIVLIVIFLVFIMTRPVQGGELSPAKPGEEARFSESFRAGLKQAGPPLF